MKTGELVINGVQITDVIYVDPSWIDWQEFEHTRLDWIGESLRLLIQLARKHVTKPYYIFVPKKNPAERFVKFHEMDAKAKCFSDHMLTLYELALYWAQQISLKEARWQDITNGCNLSPWYWAVIQKVLPDGTIIYKRTGCSTENCDYNYVYTLFPSCGLDDNGFNCTIAPGVAYSLPGESEKEECS